MFVTEKNEVVFGGLHLISHLYAQCSEISIETSSNEAHILRDFNNYVISTLSYNIH